MTTAAELRQQLAAEAAENEAHELQRKNQSLAWAQLAANPANWEWTVKPGTDSVHPYGKDDKIVGAHVAKRMIPSVLAEWAKGGHSTWSSDFQQKDRWFSMFYYRTDENILTHCGGGYCILRDPKLCSDEEWKQILEGNIPAKYIL